MAPAVEEVVAGKVAGAGECDLSNRTFPSAMLTPRPEAAAYLSGALKVPTVRIIRSKRLIDILCYHEGLLAKWNALRTETAVGKALGLRSSEAGRGVFAPQELQPLLALVLHGLIPRLALEPSARGVGAVLIGRQGSGGRAMPCDDAVCSCHLAPPSRCHGSAQPGGTMSPAELMPALATPGLMSEPGGASRWVVHLLEQPADALLSACEASWLARMGFPAAAAFTAGSCSQCWAALFSGRFSVRAAASDGQDGGLQWRLRLAIRPQPATVPLSWLTVMSLLTLLDQRWLAVRWRAGALPLSLRRFESLASAILDRQNLFRGGRRPRAGADLGVACRVLIEQALRRAPKRALDLLADSLPAGESARSQLRFPEISIPPSLKFDPLFVPFVEGLLRQLVSIAENSTVDLNTMASNSITSAWGSVRESGSRLRDLFPLPPCDHSYLAHQRPAWPLGQLSLAGSVVNTVIVCLNVMYGYATTVRRAQILGIHRDVHLRLADAVARAGHQLGLASPPGAADRVLDDLTNMSAGSKKAVRLNAADCDVFARCGEVDPMAFMSKEDRDILADVQRLFPGYHRDLRSFGQVSTKDKGEYVKYVAKQLHCRKVVLRADCKAGGTVFPISKSSGKQRIIWHGEALSEATVAPPKPPCLASPSSLLWLEAPSGVPFRLTKRDGEAMFDQLRVPGHLIPYLAGPSVTRADLQAETRWSDAVFLQASGWPALPPPHQALWPCLAVWPMGFSWSSYACQSTSLSVAARAGLDENHLLCDSRPPPVDTGAALAIATDDLAYLSCRGEADALAVGSRLDHALVEAGIQKNASKDVDACVDGTIIGIDLCDGRHLHAGRHKLAAWLCATLCLLGQQKPRLSKDGLSALLGIPHWAGQLRRPVYSCLHEVYSHGSSESASDAPCALTSRARGELVVLAGYMLLCQVDLQTQWSTQLVATDASPAFGFGVSKVEVGAAVAREAGHFAKLADTYVTLDEAAAPQTRKPRRGLQRSLGVAMNEFSTVVSSKAVHLGHAGTLEAVAVNLALRWLARSRRWHACRTPLLCDAQAVLGAVRKGRTSAPSLAREIRRTGALLLAMQCLLFISYIPSEWNPADRPSRGRPVGPGRSR